MSDRGDYKEPAAGQWMVVVHPYDGDVACMKVDRVTDVEGNRVAWLSDGSAWGVETGAPIHRRWAGHRLWPVDPVYLPSDIDRLLEKVGVGPLGHETQCEIYALLLSRRPS